MVVCSGARYAAQVEADIQEQSGARSRYGLVVQKPGNTKVIVAQELDFSIKFVERQMLMEELVVCVRHDASVKGKKMR